MLTPFFLAVQAAKVVLGSTTNTIKYEKISFTNNALTNAMMIGYFVTACAYLALILEVIADVNLSINAIVQEGINREVKIINTVNATINAAWKRKTNDW